ncbi:unnamed protein product [Owenia fusiformis]|uniref:Uncharacterized protein n=1 Tax=Owenia fusiformis TaxID=6347 RepID=A0A8J1UNS9_OWEFU|nr:unnamed protein product [Owenia fusiformis]
MTCGERCKMVHSIEDVRSPLLWRAVLAELIGTLFLTFIGCGSCIGWLDDYDPSMVQIALAFGLGVATMVWSIAHVSGGHINPAVTCGMLVTRKISVARSVFYVIAQSIGAIAGAGILKGVTPGNSTHIQVTLGATTVNSHVSVQQAFGIELMITFVLVFTVFASCDGKRTDLKGSGPLQIGLSVTLCHLFAIKYTGSSMNPARSLGPAVVQGIWQDHWVYWTGPILGGVIAALLYDSVFAANASITRAKGYLMSSNYQGDDYEPVKDKIELVEKLPIDD